MNNPDKKTKDIYISESVYSFLMSLTKKAKLDHSASHADMIRNVVLEDLQQRIHNVYTRRKL